MADGTMQGAAPAMREPMTGTLDKKGKIGPIQFWRARFCKLTGANLDVYKAEGDATSGATPEALPCGSSTERARHRAPPHFAGGRGGTVGARGRVSDAHVRRFLRVSVIPPSPLW